MLQRKLAGPDLEPGRAAGGPGAVGKATLTGALPIAARGPTGQPTKGSGAPLSPTARQKLEAAFGADFSAVRVHEDGLAEAHGAKAYAEGTELHFAPGHYDPDSEAGLALIGHELAHVVQQSQGRVTGGQGKGGVNADPGLEAEADDLGLRAARGEQVARAGAVGSAGGVKQLKPSRALVPTDEGRPFRVHLFVNDPQTRDGTYRRTTEQDCWFSNAHDDGEFAIRSGGLECTPLDGQGDHVAPHAPLSPNDGPTMGTGTAGLKASQILDALRNGCRLLDLAEDYHNLEEVARAIRASGIPRAQLQLIFKLKPVTAKPTEQGWELRIAHGVKRTLELACVQLQTAYLDVVMLHDLVASPEIIQVNLKALKQLKSANLFHQLGLSNVTSVKELEAFGDGVTVIENELNPLHQDVAVREAARQLGLAYVGYGALGGSTSKDEILNHPALAEIAQQLDVSVPQLVLAWAMTIGTVQLPTSRDSDRQRSNLEAKSLCPLDRKWVTAIEQLDRKDDVPVLDDKIGGEALASDDPVQKLRDLLFKVTASEQPSQAMMAVWQHLTDDPHIMKILSSLKKTRPRALQLAQEILAFKIGECGFQTTAQAMLLELRDFRM